MQELLKPIKAESLKEVFVKGHGISGEHPSHDACNRFLAGF